MADSGDSSPHSAAATDDTHHEGSEAAAAAATTVTAPPVHAPPPHPPPKARLMVSYGGRIQPRPHDNQLAYVHGETKILSLERPLRFADFAARLTALVGNIGDFCVKYQLPGEDLDALISVTNDEDLEHLVIEYDRLHLLRPAPSVGGGSSRGCALRLRVFLFPVQSSPSPPPPPQPSGLLEPKPERHWFVEALSAVPVPPAQGSPPPQQKQESVFAQQSSPPQQKQESVFAQQSSPPQQKQEALAVSVQQQLPPVMVQAPAPQQPVVLAPLSPDYLFGLDNGFVPPPAVKVKDPAGDPPTGRENVPVEIPAKNGDRSPNPVGDHVAVSPVVSPAEFHRQIQELEKLQVADNASHQPQPPAPAAAAALPRNGSDDSLTRGYSPAATLTANGEYYIPKFPEKPPGPPPSSTPPATTYLPLPGRYTSVAPGSGAEHAPFFFIPHGYYATTASPGANSYPAIYAVAPPSANGNANGSAPSHGNGMSNAMAYAPAPAHQVAYDSNGRAIYFTSVLPQYPSTVNGISTADAVLGTEPAKPVAVKPTVS